VGDLLLPRPGIATCLWEEGQLPETDPNQRRIQVDPNALAARREVLGDLNELGPARWPLVTGGIARGEVEVELTGYEAPGPVEQQLSRRDEPVVDVLGEDDAARDAVDLKSGAPSSRPSGKSSSTRMRGRTRE
jgi:hypothetical protein